VLTNVTGTVETVEMVPMRADGAWNSVQLTGVARGPEKE